jgi:hypothetical protein
MAQELFDEDDHVEMVEAQFQRLAELKKQKAAYRNRPHEDARAAQGGACYTWEDDFPNEAEELAELEALCAHDGFEGVQS